jgi:hypothetical protein
MNIAEQAYKQGITHCTLGFSTGKDSVMGLDMLLKAGIKVLPIYCYIVPELEFVENNIKLYEDHFGVKVVRMPHPILYDYIRHQDWQPLHIALDFAGSIKLKKLTFDLINKRYLTANNLQEVYQYDANCMKMADSINRRLLLRSLPDIDEERKIMYIAKYLTDKQIFEHFKTNRIPLTEDYKIFGRSWDGLSYHFLTGVKKHYPRDYEKIRSYFELIEAEILRYKIVRKHDNTE